MSSTNYYEFPGGIQAIDIARHLTGNASHAVCYIARSCRLDGNNKGEVESDLRKAIDFLKDELDRIAQCEKPKNLNDWTDVAREVLGAKFTELHDARVGTIWQTREGTIWVKSETDKWEVINNGLRGGSTDNFGLAERIVCD